MILFPFAEYWWIYAIFLVMVSIILLLDLGVFNKEPHPPTFKEASTWTIVWVGLSALFNYGFYYYVLTKFSNSPELLPAGTTAQDLANKLGLEFLGGYVVEKTLAVDNIFVFAMVFTFFKVPLKFQHKVLFWGIIGALVFRGLFIALGSFLMQYHTVVVGFGVLLIFTGLKMLFQKDDGDLKDKWIIKFIKRILPVSDDDGKGSFFIRSNGILAVTPLFVALVVIEVSDIVFAVDSVPAIFALTNEPLIVFTSNILAILGLRSMYFMISGVMEKFEYIKYGLASVLIFVGVKMSVLNVLYGGKFPIVWSLIIIFGLILSSVLYSLYRPRTVKA